MAGRLSRVFLLGASLLAVSALVRQSGWLFWQEDKNIPVLALTFFPYLTAFFLLSGVERTRRREPSLVGMWSALGLLLMTALLYLPSGLGGPAFVVYPLLLVFLSVPVFTTLFLRARHADG